MMGVSRRADSSSLSIPALIELAIRSGEGVLTIDGALAVSTYGDTGRSSASTYVTATDQDTRTAGTVARISSDEFNELWTSVERSLRSPAALTVTGSVGTTDIGFDVRVTTDFAWSALFTHYFLDSEQGSRGSAPLHVLHAPMVRDVGGRRRAIALDPPRSRALAFGTHYAGELKNLVLMYAFAALTPEGHLPLHSGASLSPSTGDVSIFLGSSGSGKSSLAARAEALLIGDDAHIWSDTGLISLDAGCYATAGNLTSQSSPALLEACTMFSAILQDVAVDPQSRTCDFSDTRATTNTCAAFPAAFLRNYAGRGVFPEPRNVFLLVYDPIGVLPPIARLSTDDAVTWFALGYSGTRTAVDLDANQPEQPFARNPCFAAPFIPGDPADCVRQFRSRLDARPARAWLLNTGMAWRSGHAAQIPQQESEQLVMAAESGQLDAGPWSRCGDLHLWATPAHPTGEPAAVAGFGRRMSLDLAAVSIPLSS